jgi:hypothetical protein
MKFPWWKFLTSDVDLSSWGISQRAACKSCSDGAVPIVPLMTCPEVAVSNVMSGSGLGHRRE